MTQTTTLSNCTSSHTLHALVINLLAQKAGALHSTVGELPHAAFYAVIEAIDPSLSAPMHEAQARSAFSLSPLFGYAERSRQGRIEIGQGQSGWLRLSLLDAHLFQAFTHHILENARPTIRIGDIPFAITEVLGAPGSHPWSGYTTLGALHDLDETPDRWTLEFASPTAIRWGAAGNGARRVELFPQPRMAIAGLRKRWDDLTGEAWGRDFEEWVEGNVVVSRIHHWRTQPFLYRRQRYTGGVGQLEYRLLDTSRADHAAHLNRLWHLAFYTGIGYKTSHGLGLVRLL